MWTFGHWNGSESGWVQSGPYIHGWFTTREEAQEKMEEWRKEHPESDGWRCRVEVLSEEQYYERTYNA